MKYKKSLFVYGLVILFVIILTVLWYFLFNFYDNNRKKVNNIDEDKVLLEIIDLGISYNGDYVDLDSYIS